jgi:hypothetical protein
MKIKSRSKASRLKPVPQGVHGAFSGTGFSREEAGMTTIIFLGNTLHVGALNREISGVASKS